MRRKLSPLLTFLIGLMGLLLPQDIVAQSFTLERYNAENGLPEAYIYTLAQDERGFLYVGTGAGLFQFSGQSFTRLTRAHGLAEDFTTCSYRDRKNRLWFGHFEGGLTLMEDLRFRSVLDSSLLNSSITGIVEDEAGNIWVAAQRNGLVRIAPDMSVQAFPKGWEDGLTLALAAAPNKHLLVGTDAGLQVVKLTSQGPVIDRKATLIPNSKINAISSRPKRPGYWIATEDEGLWEYIPGAIPEKDTATGFMDTLRYPNISCIIEDDYQRVWLGVPGNGFLSYDDRISTDRMRPYLPISPSDTLGQKIIRCLFRDRFGQIWMGTYGDGLYCLSESNFTTIQLGYPEAPKQVNVVLEDKAGNFWIGTLNGLYTVTRFVPEHFGYTYTIGKPILMPAVRAWNTTNGLPADEITALFEDKRHNVWVGTKTNGVALINAKRDSVKAVELSDLVLSKSINAITEDKQGYVWIATTDGAFRYDAKTGQSRSYTTRNGLAHNNISDIYPDRHGRLWFITHTNRLCVFNGKGFEVVKVSEAGEVPNVNCIVEDMAGNLWIGTDGMGLYKYNGNTFKNYNEQDGLLSNYVYFLTPDRYDNIWLAHRKGFTRYITKTDKFIPYPNKTQFQYEENPLYSAYMDKKGNIWYGSEQGAIRYNWIPSRTSNAPPYTFIRSMEIADYAGDLSEGASLPYNSYRIKFNFLGLTFLQQEDVRYQYKLEGLTPDWSDPFDETSVTLQGLEDGSYTFVVRACNAMGNCNEVPAKFSFRIQPPFWKTWWFRIFMVILAAGAIYAFVRYRTYRLNAEKEALENRIEARTSELKEEKEKVEHANRELEKLSLVASNTDNAVFILDPQGNLEWVNDGFTRLTGHTYGSLITAYPSRNVLDFSSNPEFKELMEKAVKAKISVQYESQIPTTNGEKIWVLSTLTTVNDADGNLRNIIIIDSNITERKKAEEQIKLMNTELERLVAARTEQLRKENEEHIKTAERLKVINKELDTFVYRASHDLKGPLASLLGLINIASGELEGNAVAERYLGLMERAGKRLDGILVDLIEATQVKQGAAEYSKIEVRPFVDQIIDSLSNRPDFDKMSFELDIPQDLGVVSDKKLFLSILQNYIDNSIKYRDVSKPSSNAKISVQEQGDSIEIAVSDNGTGIPEDLQGRVFDMFFRGSKQATGSGLGLYIVQQAAEKLGGSIRMQSVLGEGSTFYASLPKTPPPIPSLDN